MKTALGLVQGVIVFTTLFLESSTTPLDSIRRFANANFSAFFVDPTTRFTTSNFSTFFVDSSTAPVDPTARFTTTNFSAFFVDPTARFTTANFSTFFVDSSTAPVDPTKRFTTANFSAFFVDPTARFTTSNFSTFFVDSSTAPVDPTARFTTANFSTFFVDSSTALVNSTARLASEARNVEQALKALAKEKAALERAMARTAALTGVAGEALAEASRKIENAIKQELLKGAVQEFVFRAYDVINAAVADAIRVTLKALAKVTNTYVQYNLISVLDWMKGVRSNFSAELEDINAALNDNPEDLESVIIRLINTRRNVTEDLPMYISFLDIYPPDLVNRVKLVIRKRFETILSNYEDMSRALVRLLPDDVEGDDRSTLTRYRSRLIPLCTCQFIR